MMTALATSARFRVRQTLVFLVVVWSIGAVFLALEASMMQLSWIGSSKVLPANIVLSRQSKAAYEHCQEMVKGLPPVQDANVSQWARYFAWRLGYVLGSGDASLGAGIAERPAVEDALRQSLPITTELGIPALALPQHGRSGYAMREFTVFLEEDTPCVAAALQFRYSPRHAALYKFGAAAGFAGVYRRLAPQLNDVLAPQLRLYGSAAGIPENLYTPLVVPSVTGSGANDGQVVQSVFDRIDAYIKSAYW